MRCSACFRPSDQLRHVEHHRRFGFGYRTTHAFLCPTCAPAPVAPAGVIAPPATPPRGEGAGASFDSNAPGGACTEGAWYPTPSAATSAENADEGEKGSTSFCREDETAGRDRRFEIPLGTRPEFFLSVTALQLNTEGPNHEVAVGDGAVIPARTCAPLGMCPGSNSGPGYTSPGGMVGRAGSGRAA